MDVNTKLENLIVPVLEDMGYDLVRLLVSLGQRPHLQIMAERKDRKDMQIEDCESISHALSPMLDVEDVIKTKYTLEVSSPGLDRPLVREGDFERFAGNEVKLETAAVVGDKKRFAGRLLGLKDSNVLMQVEGEEINIPYDMVVKAKLVLTDELIRNSINNSKNKEVKDG